MKIAVLSDTHIPLTRHGLPGELLKAIQGSDLILHAGDMVELWVLEDLQKIAKVEAVSGNMDSPKVKELLPEKKTLDIGGKKICVMHGYGNPAYLIPILKEAFLRERPDVIVFGHSHRPINEMIDGVLFFNPGSPTDSVFAPYRSYGIIEIDDKGTIKAGIHKL